jgi:hypothetical protein
MKVRVGKKRIKKGKGLDEKESNEKIRGVFFFSHSISGKEILGTFFTAPPFFLSFPLFLSFSFFFFPCPSFFFLMIDIGPAILSLNQKNAPAGISLRLSYGKEKKNIGGREGRKTLRPSYFFLSQPNLTKPPLSVFSLWKNSPCSVNLEKKLEGAETG